ncbi:MAG TPA: alpha-1,2-fucosyltransferase [Burkholderiales bacterium]|nr:alpha-1,2-fucosyltransferase [Burkholderiales bacterium]
MIITNLVGGLGNQMFQYAFGRALALRHGVALRLDARWFGYYRLHAFALRKAFALPVEKARAAELRAVLGWRRPVRVLGVLRRPAFSGLRGARLLVDDLRQAPALTVAGAPATCYLLGYWQSESYFAAAAGEVRRDFRFPALDGANRAWAQRIGDSIAVSVHVRRADYTDPATQAVHGLCTPDYYARAMAHVAERAPGAQFFVFSDDLAWARAALAIPHRHHFVEGNGPEGNFHDMHLISLCRHHVIANSSFSWWGAWLCSQAGKIVVAPARWMARADPPEIVPASWARL